MNSARERLIELYEDRENFGELKDKTHELKHVNPLCDDEITLQLKVEGGVIKDIKFKGVGCFISTAASAALAEKVKGMKVEDAMKITKEDMDKFMGIDVLPTRIKCELLPLEALKKLKCLK